MNKPADTPITDGAAAFAFPVATSMWALLAFIDGHPDRTHELMDRIRDWTPGIPGRWRPPIMVQMSFADQLILLAIKDNVRDMWTPAQMIDGVRTLAKELVPAERLDSAMTEIDRYGAWSDTREAMLAADRTYEAEKLQHPWTTTDLGSEPEAWAALTLAAWVCRQPQAIRNSPHTLREDVLTAALRYQSAADKNPHKWEPLPDAAARELVRTAFGGEDLFDIPTNPDRHRTHHRDVLSITRQWMYEHPDATPPSDTQLTELRRQIQVKVLGMADPDANAYNAAIPADTPPPTKEVAEAVELLGLRLLASVIDADTSATTEVVNTIDQHGEIGYRLAWTAVQEMAAMWMSTMWDTARPNSAQLLPGIQAVIDHVVPEAKRAATLIAYGPVIAKFVDEDGGDLHPVPTDDVEADLWLMTAFTAWCATQPAVDPPRAREQLTGSIAYLQRPDRASTDNVDLADMATALPVLHDTVPAPNIARIRGLIVADGVDAGWVLSKTAQMANAARDAAAGDPHAIHQIQRLDDMLQQTAIALADRTPASKHTTTSPDDQATRRNAERALRKRKKKK